MLVCVACSEVAAPGAELTRCESCNAVAHRLCRESALGKCPKCGGSISPDLYYEPETPGLDILFHLAAAFAGLTALLFLGGIVGMIYSLANGLAFYLVAYFYMLPCLVAVVVFGGTFGAVWMMRADARRPKRIGA
jgi:hypothetical protein